MKVKQAVKAVKRFGVKNRNVIFTTLTVAGIWGTTVVALRKGPKIQSKLDTMREENASKKDILLAVAPDLLPVVGLAGTTTALTIINGVKSEQKAAALTSALTLAQTSAAEFKEAAIDEIGEKKVEEIREKISKKHADDVPQKVYGDADVVGVQLCFLKNTGQYFWSNPNQIDQVINKLNHELTCGKVGMYVTLNELAKEFGCPETIYGKQFGWDAEAGQTIERENWISGLRESDKMPYLQLELTAEYPLFGR